MKLKKLLSVVISLTLLLSLISVPVFADGGNVAKIGDTEYATLEDAIAAAQDGDTVKLLADITLEPQTIGGESVKYGAYITKNLTIDGDNHVITSHAARAFGVKGVSGNIDVTFKNVVINNGVSGAICICTRGGIGTLTLNNVTLNTQGCTSGYNQPLTIGGTQYTQAKVIVEDSLIQTNDEASKYYAIILWNPVDLSIKNSTIKGWACVYQKPFEDGTVDKTEVAIDNCTLISKGLKGSTNHFSAIFTEEGGFSCVVTNSIIDVTAAENTYQGVAASNGTSGFSIELGEGNNVTLTGDTALIGYNFDDIAHEISVSGGTFNVPVATEYCANGYFPADNGNGVYGVDGPYVAAIGNAKYETLSAAVAAANEIGNVTVTLLKDYDMEGNEPGHGWTTSYVAQGETVNRDNMIVISGNDITLDLGGYTLSNLYNNTFKVTGTNVTFQNGEMTLGQLYYGEFSNGVITKVYTTPSYGSYIVLVKEATNFVVNDLTTFGGINVSASTATINNLSFSGLKFYAVCSQSGSEVTINNGTYSKAVAGAANKLFWVEPGSVMNITGGNFIKGNADFCAISATSIAPVITGGTFDFDPTAYLAADYTAVNNGDGTWTVNSDYAAKIGNAKYETLAAAVAAVQDGETITIISDMHLGNDTSRSNTANIDKAVTVDLNGHTIERACYGADIFKVKDGGILTITDSSANETGLVDAQDNGWWSYPVQVVAGGKLILEKGTLRGKANGVDIASNGEIVVNGGAIIGLNGQGISLSGMPTVCTVNGGTITANNGSALYAYNDATVTINGGTFTALTDGYYAGIAICDRDNVTINGGTFTGPYAIQDKSTINAALTITGGTFNGTTALFSPQSKWYPDSYGKMAATISGGNFSDDPTTCAGSNGVSLADGFEAVDNGDDTWTVGEVKASEPEIEATPAAGYDVSYTVKKQVVDANNSVITEGDSRTTVNIKTVTENTVYKAETTSEFIDNLDMNKVLDSVVASADAGDTVNVEIKVVCTEPEVVNETITYEVHPEAIVSVNDNPPETVRISNDALGENAVFTIKLPVPEALEGNDYVKVTHRSTGYADDVQLHAVKGEAGNRYVQFDVTHFSEFELASNNLPLFAGHSVTLNGYINLNFYLNLAADQVTNGDGTVVNFTWGRGSAQYKVKTTDFVSGKGYKATVQLPAAEMTYGITATVEINGTEQAETNTYSVRQYADELLAIADPVNDAKLINLVNAMLDYGAKAQIAFGRTDGVDLANEGIGYDMPYYSRGELLGLIDNAISAANNGMHATAVRDVAEAIGAESYYSSSLIYLSGCTLRHYFFGYGLDASKFTGVKSDYYYYVDKTNIAAADLDKLQEFHIGDLTFHYSALDFVKAIIYNYTEGYNYDLAVATYWYNQAANAYFE